VTLTLRPNSIFPDVDRVRVTIDKQTGLPVWIIATLHGALRSETLVDHVRIDRPLPRSVFTIHVPKRFQVLTTALARR
jgi:outer membrane lipoprotein-sorting protein